MVGLIPPLPICFQERNLTEQRNTTHLILSGTLPTYALWYLLGPAFQLSIWSSHTCTLSVQLLEYSDGIKITHELIQLITVTSISALQHLKQCFFIVSF